MSTGSATQKSSTTGASRLSEEELRRRGDRANACGMADYDLLLKDGIVVDGTRSQRYRADVAIRDGKVATIGRVRPRTRSACSTRAV
jgi:adenine deaminase